MTKTRTILLGAAAALSLGFAPVAASAEMLSSPAELSQTRALNASAQSGTYASPCSLNGEKAQEQSAQQLRYGQATHTDCASRHAKYSSRYRHRTNSYAHNYHATTPDSGRSYGRMNQQVGTAATPGYSTQSSYAYGQSASGQTAYDTRTAMTGPANNVYATREYGASGPQPGSQYDESRSRMAYGAMGDQQTAQNAPRGEDYNQGGGRGSYEQGSYSRPNFNAEGFVSLKAVDPDRLANVSVETTSGTAIGRVSDVTLARDGTPSEIEIALNNGRVARLSASSLRYNPNERILLTNLDARELQSSAGGGAEFRE